MPGGPSRGYNVAALDPDNGTLVTASFDVPGQPALGREFAAFVAAVPVGHLIAIAVQDDGATGAREAVWPACEALGAKQIGILPPMMPWVFATIKGNPGVLLEELIYPNLTATVTLRSRPGSHEVAVEAGRRDGTVAISMSRDGSDFLTAPSGSFMQGSWMIAYAIDPATGSPSGTRAFPLDVAQSPGAAVKEFVDAIAEGDLVLVALSLIGDAARLDDDSRTALTLLGAVRQGEIAIGRSYALVGRKGALPGTVAESVVAGATRLSIQLDDSGGWAPSRMAILCSGENFVEPFLALQNDSDQPYGLGSLRLAPGTGATITWANGKSADFWGASPVVGFDGSAPTSISLWPTAGRSAAGRVLLRQGTAGSLLAPNFVFPRSPVRSPFVSNEDNIDQWAFVQVVRGRATTPGHCLGDVAGTLPPGIAGSPWDLTLAAVPGSNRPAFTRITRQGDSMLINDEGEGAFSLSPPPDPAVTPAADPTLWMSKSDQTFTSVFTDRLIFTEAFRLSDAGLVSPPLRPGQAAGEPGPGEIVVHTADNFFGDAWGFDVDLPRFELVHPDAADPAGSRALWPASVRCGPQTGVRLFRGASFTGDAFDLLGDCPAVPSEWRTSIGSMQILRLTQPNAQPMAVSVVLSDDLRIGSDGALEEFEAYRTTVSLPPNISMVEIRATDAVTVTIGKDSHEIGPDAGVVIRPNAVRRLVVTADAASLGTAGLRFRTDTMRADEWFPVHPDRFVHGTLAVLQDVIDADAAPFAADTGLGGHGQRALGHLMGAIAYQDVPTVLGPAHSRAVSSRAMDHPGWQLALPRAGTRDDAGFSHFTSQADLDAAIAGAVDGDAGGRERSAGNWNGVLDGTLHLDAIIVHKTAAGAPAPLRAVVRYVDQGQIKALAFALPLPERLIQLGELVAERLGSAVRRIIAKIKLVFSWPDILRAQGEIAKALTAALAAAPAQLAAIESQVHAFIVARKTGVAAAIDATIAEYAQSHATSSSVVGAAGGPAQHKDSVDTASEKAHWLLAKIADHHAGHAPKASPAAPPLPSSFLTLIQAIETQVSEGSSVMDSLKAAGEALRQAVAHPTNAPVLVLDALLQAAKAAIVAGLDVLDAISLALLAAAADAVALLVRLATDEWDLPFLGALWAWLMRNAPEPKPALNALNVAALLGAIPASVASNLITGVAPFAPAPAPSRTDTQPPPPNPLQQLKRSWGFAAGGLSLAGSILAAVLDIQAVEATVSTSTTTYSYQVGGVGEWTDRTGARRRIVPWLDVDSARGLGTSLECICFLVGIAATVAASPGGYPNHDFDVSPSAWNTKPDDYLDAVAWVFDMCTFAIDLAFLLLPSRCMARRGPVFGLAIATCAGTSISDSRSPAAWRQAGRTPRERRSKPTTTRRTFCPRRRPRP